MPTVTAKATGLLIRWTEPSQSSVKEYWVYARNDGNTAVTTAHIVAKLGYGTDTFFYPYDNFNESSNVTFHLKAISWAGKSSALSAILCADTTTVAPRFGNTASYTEIGDSGQITFLGAQHNKIGTMSIHVLNVGTTKPTSVNIGNFTGYEYGIGDDSKFQFPIHKDLAGSSDVTLYVLMYVNEAFVTNSAYVSWQIDYACVPLAGGESMDSPTHTGQVLSGATAIPALARNLILLTAVITATDVAKQDIIGVTFTRIANAGAEPNPGVEPVIVDVCYSYAIDKLSQV